MTLLVISMSYFALSFEPERNSFFLSYKHLPDSLLPSSSQRLRTIDESIPVDLFFLHF